MNQYPVHDKYSGGFVKIRKTKKNMSDSKGNKNSRRRRRRSEDKGF